MLYNTIVVYSLQKSKSKLYKIDNFMFLVITSNLYYEITFCKVRLEIMLEITFCNNL